MDISYVLLTGGSGYIGLHISYFLLLRGYKIVIIDIQDKTHILKKNIEKELHENILYYEYNLLDIDNCETIFKNHSIKCVIHLAGFKSVGESIENPHKYYNNNIVSTLNLCSLMIKYNVENIIFSSSATVYGKNSVPNYEYQDIKISDILNPYGKSKYIQEEILKDFNFNTIILRYFNPIGQYNKDFAEDYTQRPNNLYPIILRTYYGLQDYFNIYGNDHDTKDGTCRRDFIHVNDLAYAHIYCMEAIFNNKLENKINIYNVGTGVSTSVKECVEAFEKINNIKLKYFNTEKRDGDIVESYANVDKIYKEINWKAIYNINDAVKI